MIKPNKRQTYCLIPPLGLGYLATSLRKYGHEPFILNCQKDNLSVKDLQQFITKFQPGIVGIQGFPDDVPIINKYLKMIRRDFPKVVNVVGGPLSSGFEKETFEIIDPDYAFKGEAEKGFPMLVNLIENSTLSKERLKEIPGLIYKDIFSSKGKNKNPDVIVNPPFFEMNLDNLGFPAWDLMDPNTYPETYHGAFAKQTPVALLMTKRGCPYKCTFCAGHTIGGYRVAKRSLKHIMEEVDMLYFEYGVRELHIEDDGFSLIKKDVEDFCKALIKRNYGITWSTPNGLRMEILDKPMLKLLKDSGCYCLHLGIESGSDAELTNIKKQIHKDTVRKRVKLIHDMGFRTVGLFIIGMPGETEAMIKETIDFSLELELDRAQIGMFLPLPGSTLFKELRDDGKLGKIKWANYDSYSHVSYIPDGLTEKKLKKYQRNAFLKFYLRPKILYRFLKDINSPDHFFRLFKRAIAFGK